MSERRLAVVVAGCAAVPPPGVPADAFAAAALADTYEVLAGLDGITAGIAGSPEYTDLLWPDSLLLPGTGVRAAADAAGGDFDALVLVPADVPDLPQLVVAKVFKALIRAQVCLAPERGGNGLAALGIALPWPGWLPDDLDLDDDPYSALAARVPDRRLLVRSPDWHRLRTPAATDRLDPGLEGWEETRALLSGRPLTEGLR
jgi:hypothetical protein